MEREMPRHYVYRMDHDTGFAPNTDYGVCTLGGCKVTTVERWADKGGWVIGIGGNGTGRPNKLIYAMEVEEGLPYSEFKEKYPRKSRYLSGKPVPKVLVSRRFYYFGDMAIDLPEELQHLVINRQGCKRVSDEDVAKLAAYLAAQYEFGRIGKPNNPQPQKLCAKCRCAG
jgi:hypothetical protein